MPLRPARAIVFALSATLACTAVGGTVEAHAQDPVPVAAATSAPAARVLPASQRSCSFYNCTVYFNRHETHMFSDGLSLVWTLCAVLRTTPLAIACAGFTGILGRVADRAIGEHNCVKVRFNRWFPYPPTFGTYRDSRCY